MNDKDSAVSGSPANTPNIHNLDKPIYNWFAQFDLIFIIKSLI